MTRHASAKTDDLYDPELRYLLHDGIARLRRNIDTAAPLLGARVASWMEDLSQGAGPEAYFTHRRSFPMLLLPWWLERTFGVPNRTFHGDVLYSTVNGYLFIRMLDDVMDRETRAKYEILPALAFFHTEFQRAYQPHFPSDHLFWRAFVDTWFASAEVTARDAAFVNVTRSHFKITSSRKISAAKIPLAAVCYRYNRTKELVDWYRLVDRLGLWHQMLNDVRGWSRDLEKQRPTYFLSEALKRKEHGESVPEWVLRTGLTWAAEQLEAFMDPLLDTARELRSPPLVAYLEQRKREFAIEWRDVGASVKVLREFAALVDAKQSTVR